MSKNLLLIIFILFGHTTFAQHSEEAVRDTVNLKELIITGTKLPSTQRETAKQVTLISKEEIEKSRGKDLSQVLHEQSGIIINGTYSNPSQNKGVYVRGGGTDNTLILIDGQPLYDPSGVGGAIDLRLLPLEQVERIEILKGSQSTLYGTDAMAGVINIITNKSIDKKINVFGTASYGSMNTLKTNMGIRGKISLVDYNISYFRNSSDGISEAKDSTNSQSFDKDGYFQNGFQSNLSFHLSEKIKFSPYFRFADFEGDFDSDAFIDGENKYDSKIYQSGGEIAYSVDKLNLNLNYGYSKSDRLFVTDFGESPFHGRFHNIDAFGQYKFSNDLKLLGGLNYQYHQMAEETSQVEDSTINITSPYLTLIWRPVNRLTFELGYRYSRHNKFGSNSSYSIAPAYYLTENLKVFANYTTGFKTPTLSQLFGFGGNPNLEPEKSGTYEIGLAGENVLSHLSGEIVYFRRKIDDIITYDFSTGYINRDQQNDEGLEVRAKWLINKTLSIEGFYNYVDGRLTTLDSNGEETEENNLIRRPKHRFSLSASFDLLENLSVSLGGQYMGNRFDYYFNPNNFYTREEVGLDAYFLLNSYAEYRLLDNHLILFVELKNMTDTDFMEVYGYNTIGFNVQSGLRFQL